MSLLPRTLSRISDNLITPLYGRGWLHFTIEDTEERLPTPDSWESPAGKEYSRLFLLFRKIQGQTLATPLLSL